MVFLINLVFYFLGLFIAMIIALSYYLYKQKKPELINKLVSYFFIVFIILCVFIVFEFIFQPSLLLWQFVLLCMEISFVVCLITIIYFTIFIKHHIDKKSLYMYVLTVIIITHIILSFFLLTFFNGSVITTAIFILNLVIFKNINKYKKRTYLISGVGWYFYISINILNEMIVASLVLLVASLIILLAHNEVNARIITNYHTIRTIMNHRTKNNLDADTQQNVRKPKFWISKITLKQIGKTEKENPKSLLQNFFSTNETYCLKIILNNDNFDISLLIRARTRAKCEEKTNIVLLNLKSIYKGLDAVVRYMPVSKNYLYKKNKIWILKFPKGTYTQQINLMSKLIALFRDDQIKFKFYIMWKRAPPQRILEPRSKIELMTYKDPVEKSQYSQMWRDELFNVKIYLSYQTNRTNSDLDDYEAQRIKGKIKSLEIAAKDERKNAKIKRVLCGNRASFLRGIIYGGNNLTPLAFDFSLTENLPLFSPIGLKRQVINWGSHKQDPLAFRLGKWIDNYKVVTEKHVYGNVDDFNLSACIIGTPKTGKTSFIKYLMHKIKEKKPNVGILFINYKRSYKNKDFYVDKRYSFGVNLRVPYFVVNRKKGDIQVNRIIQEVATIIMGSLGCLDEATNACQNVLEEYIGINNWSPIKINDLLKSVESFVGHNYQGEVRANILSVLRSRIQRDIDKPIIEATLRADINEANWIKDLKEGKIVEINLSDCGKWQQRLITTLVLQNIKTLIDDEEIIDDLRLLIVIDEAHRVLGNSEAYDEKSDDFVACRTISEVFKILIEEFRDRGIGFIISNQTAENLHNTATSIPRLKFLFSQSLKSAKVFTDLSNDIEIITSLGNRQVYCNYAVKSEIFTFKTMDFYDA